LAWNLFHKVILAEEKAGRLSTKVLQVIKQAFDNLDSDGSGSVSAEEMASLLCKMGVQLNGDKFMELVGQIDTDGNGEITFFEFLQVGRSGRVTSWSPWLCRCRDRTRRIADGRGVTLAQAMCNDSGLLGSELRSALNPSKLATVDAYVLSSSVEEIEKIMVCTLIPPRICCSDLPFRCDVKLPLYQRGARDIFGRRPRHSQDTKSLALFSRIAVNILERLHKRKQRQLHTKTKSLKDIYEENVHQALEGALDNVIEQVEGQLGDLEGALDSALHLGENTRPDGDVELSEGMSEELINHDQRRRLRIIMNMAIVRAFVAGLVCGMIGKTSHTSYKLAAPQPGSLIKVLHFDPLLLHARARDLPCLAAQRSAVSSWQTTIGVRSRTWPQTKRAARHWRPSTMDPFGSMYC
jgi:hypothetical protein